MAENMDENEIKAVADAMDELRRTGNLSADSLSKLSGSSDASKKALEGFSKQVLGVGKAVGGMATALAEGQGSFSSMSSIIQSTTKVMGGLLSAIPVVGGAMKAMAEGVGEASAFVLKQLDVMASNYQTLGDASAGAVDGLDGLYRQFTAMGNYSLPAFTKAIKANTVGMAAFRGSATDGAEEFSKIAGSLTKGDIGERFLRLGYSLDGVGDAAINFVSISSRMGLLQGSTTEELTKKTQNYIEEVDKIARITGQTREQQQQEAQKSLLNVRFRAKLADMAANGQAEAAIQLKAYAEGVGGAGGDAIRALATGIPLTKEAAQANLIAGDAYRQNALSVIAGKHATDAISDTMIAGAEAAKLFNNQMSFSGDIAGGAAVQMLDYQEIVAQAAKNGITPAKQAELNQKKQSEASGALTKDYTRAQMAVANTNKNIQELGFTLAVAAIPAVETFAEGLETMTDFINDHFGGIASSKKADAQNEENWNNMKIGSKVLHGIAIGIEKTGSAIGLEAWSRHEKESRLESETKEFKSTKGVSGVNKDLVSAVEKATAEYKAVTGRTATITSGVRDRAEQQKLYDAYIARGKTGMPVAKPGSSMHETGQAVDIDKISANAMDRLGILAKYGLNRPVAGDPVHVQLAGPSGRLKNNMAGVGPTVDTSNQPQSATATTNANYVDNKHVVDQLAMMNAHLTELKQSSQRTAAAAQKTAKNTA